MPNQMLPRTPLQLSESKGLRLNTSIQFDPTPLTAPRHQQK